MGGPVKCWCGEMIVRRGKGGRVTRHLRDGCEFRVLVLKDDDGEDCE